MDLSDDAQYSAIPSLQYSNWANPKSLTEVGKRVGIRPWEVQH